jgi:hypothetical protein
VTWAVENFAPGVIARMGFGCEVLREIRPEIIMLHCPKCQGLARADWPLGVARATAEHYGDAPA